MSTSQSDTISWISKSDAASSDENNQKNLRISGNPSCSNQFFTNRRLLETGTFSDVDVYVGEEEKCYKLHRAILSNNSGYFQRLFTSSHFSDCQENKVFLKDWADPTFKWTVSWLYMGEIVPLEAGFSRLTFGELACTFKLAAYLDIASLKSKVVELMITEVKEHPYHNTYRSGGKYRTNLKSGIRILLKHYHSEAVSLKPIFTALCEEGFLPQLLADLEVRSLITEESGLTMVLLDIQSEIVRKFRKDRPMTTTITC